MMDGEEQALRAASKPVHQPSGHEPEAPVPPNATPSGLPVLLPLSARSADGVNRFAARIAARLNDDLALDIQDVAFTLQTARSPLAFRRVVVARDRLELIHALTQSVEVAAPAERTLAPVLVFPGQGAQRPGMVRALHAAFPLFRATIDACCEIAAALGADLRAHLLAEPEDPEAAAALRRTALAQPALFAVELALARLLESWGLVPGAVLGHSVGEFAAACHAGVFSMQDGMRLVCARGRLIQSLPPGAMLAVGKPAGALQPYFSDEIDLAAVNASDACVLSGPVPVIGAVADRLRAEGVRCVLLETSHAFHSAMMTPILDAFAREVRATTFRPARLPYVSGLTGLLIEDTAITDPCYWVRHLREPVQFADAAAALIDAGHRVFLEAGPGTALTNLLLRQGRSDVLARPVLPVHGLADDRTALLDTVGAAWVAGCPINWTAMHQPGARRRLALPPAPLADIRCWVDAPGEQTPAAPPVPALPRAEPDDGSIETEVIRLWRLHLGHQEIAPDADFHQLGGDSLLAIRIVATLGECFGVSIQPHVMIEARTPALLARHILALRGRTSRQSAPFMLVRLRDGDPGRPALFLPHPVGGTVHYYQPFCAALRPECRVFGLQAQALDGMTPPSRDVGATARAAIEAMRAAQPRGPYQLVGASFGGMLAYEIAQQLADAGDDVAVLAMIDTPAMEQLPIELVDGAEVVSYVAALLGRTLDPDTLRSLAREDQIANLLTVCRDVLPDGMTVADLDLHLLVFQANTDAMRHYRIERLRQRCPVLFLKAAERDPHMPTRPEASWQRVLGDQLAVREVPGSHQTMMSAPHVEAVADLIRSALSQVSTARPALVPGVAAANGSERELAAGVTVEVRAPWDCTE